MDDYSHMTRQQYRRLKMLKEQKPDRSENDYHDLDSDSSMVSWEKEVRIKRLAHHLNRIIWILIVLIVVVYLILVFINF